MIADSVLVTGLVVLLIGYLLGSIPTAYLVTRIAIGKDIRKLGGGNIGGLNTLREVGMLPAIGVMAIDFGKGAAAAAIAHWVLEVDLPYVFLAAMAAVVGHNWMVWLKFSGGKGMSTAVGSLFVVMPVADYVVELVILLGIIVVPLVITRNVALAMGLGLMALPFIAWLGGTHSGFFVVWSVVMGLMIAAKFAPTVIASIAKSSGLKEFIRGD